MLPLPQTRMPPPQSPALACHNPIHTPEACLPYFSQATLPLPAGCGRDTGGLHSPPGGPARPQDLLNHLHQVLDIVREPEQGAPRVLNIPPGHSPSRSRTQEPPLPRQHGSLSPNRESQLVAVAGQNVVGASSRVPPPPPASGLAGSPGAPWLNLRPSTLPAPRSWVTGKLPNSLMGMIGAGGLGHEWLSRAVGMCLGEMWQEWLGRAVGMCLGEVGRLGELGIGLQPIVLQEWL